MNERLARLTQAAHDLQVKLQDGSLMRGILMNHKEEIMEQQQIQLLEGKASDGQDLRPFYTEDLKPTGYFHSTESANKYRAWKESLNYPYSVKRNSNAPNLYINGRFYSEMEVRFAADSVGIFPATSYAAQIMGKYGIQNFGLSALRWQTLMTERGLKTELQQEIKSILYDN